MNTRYFQQITRQFKDAMGRDVGIILEGTVISSTEGIISDADLECVLNFANDNLDTFAYSGFTYRSVQEMGKVDFIVFVQGDDAMSRSFAEILKINKQERHIRGGLATRDKYLGLKHTDNS